MVQSLCVGPVSCPGHWRPLGPLYWTTIYSTPLIQETFHINCIWFLLCSVYLGLGFYCYGLKQTKAHCDPGEGNAIPRSAFQLHKSNHRLNAAAAVHCAMVAICSMLYKGRFYGGKLFNVSYIMAGSMVAHCAMVARGLISRPISPGLPGDVTIVSQ